MPCPPIGPRRASTPLLISLNYIFTLALPVLCIPYLLTTLPQTKPYALATFISLTTIWITWCTISKAELSTGHPNQKYSQTNWVFVRMREWFQLKLHRTDTVQQQLLKMNDTGQAIFAFWPHGVNSDFRVLMDGMMYDAFDELYSRGASGRTLTASILFWIPGIRSLTMKTGCVDAGRATAEKCLGAGHSLFLCPGGQDEQVETIYGRERLHLKTRRGFVRLALKHGIPIVPSYCFGSSDVYGTSRLLHGIRRWMVRVLRIAIPLYWGGWGFWCYPTPLGFPYDIDQNVVFGDPLCFGSKKVENPTKEQVAAAHEKLMVAVEALFDEHKKEFGCGDRKLEVL